MTTTTLEPATEPTTGTGTRILFFTNSDWAACQEMGRTLDALVGRALQVEEIDVWDAPERVVEHEVLTVPTVVVVELETEIGRIAGLIGRRRLGSRLRRILREKGSAPLPT